MKIFHKDKYQFIGINFVGDEPYYAFRCMKKDFSPEIVLVQQAKIVLSPELSLFFDRSRLFKQSDLNYLESLCVNLTESYYEIMSLVENESKWYDHRTYSEVNSLTKQISVRQGAAR